MITPEEMGRLADAVNERLAALERPERIGVLMCALGRPLLELDPEVRAQAVAGMLRSLEKLGISVIGNRVVIHQ